MKRSIFICGLFMLVVFAGDALQACLWDYDTLEMERQQFPSALELITGKFNRHSREYYQWRVDDRLKKLKDEPGNLSLLDDLAVGYEKLGRHEDAIKTMQQAEKLKPGRYETHANLGTFYIHAGRFDEGLKHIDKALAINPDAHFGRERYQKLLVEYAQLAKRDGKIQLPMSDQMKGQPFWGNGVGGPNWDSRPFGEFLKGKPESSNLNDAVTGISGMMRFGNFDSPVLLEALGDVLMARGGTEPALRLAARAYLKASYAVNDPRIRARYRVLADSALYRQRSNDGSDSPIPLEELEKELKAELAEADAYFAQIKADEIAWIKAGKDVDAEYHAKYYAAPTITPDYSDDVLSWRTLFLIGTCGLAALLAVFWLWWRIRRPTPSQTA